MDDLRRAVRYTAVITRMNDKDWCHMTAPVRTLVVEDETVVARELERLLKGFGHKVVGSVRSGEEAIRKAVETGPDLILMDISLKGDIDGIEAARTIQARIETAIVFLTARVGQDFLDRAKATEPYAYLIKPVSPKDLRITVEMAVYKHRMERRLRESELRLKLALKGADLGLWDWDLRTGTVLLNERAAEMLGYEPREMELDVPTWQSHIHPEDQTKAWGAITSHLRGWSPSHETRLRMRSGSGKWKWILVRGRITERSPDGKALRMTGTTLDVTLQKLAEEALEDAHKELEQRVDKRTAKLSQVNARLTREMGNRVRAEQALRQRQLVLDLALEGGLLGYWQADFPSGEMVVSTGWVRALGYRDDEANQDMQWWTDLVHPEDRSRFVDTLRESQGDLQPVRELEHRLRCKSGAWMWVLTRTVVVEKDPKGSSIKQVGLSVDITLRKHAEEALRQSEQRFRAVFDNLNVPIAIGDTKGQAVEVNQALVDLLGYGRDELLEKTILDVTDPEDRESVVEMVTALVTGKTDNYRLESRYLSKDGSVHWGDLSACRIRDATGKIQGLAGVVADITERKRVEADLRQRLTELTSINSLARKVNSSLSFDDVLEAAYDELSALPHVDMALIFARAGDELTLQEPLWSRMPLDETARIHRIGECLCGIATQEGVSVHARDIREDPRCTLDHCKNAGFTSFSALPLMQGEDVIGILGLASRNEHDFSVQADFLETLAVQLSVSFQNARLHGQARAQALELERRVRERTAQLQKSERLLADMFSSIQDGICVLDRDLTIVRVNEAQENAFAQAMPLVGKKCYEAFHGRTEFCEPCPSRRAMETGLTHSTVLTRKGPGNRTTSWIEVFCFPLVDHATGEVTGGIEYVREVTDRVQAEADLRRELEINAALADLYVPILLPAGSIKEIANLVLDKAKALTRSTQGFVSEIDPETGDNAVHTATEMVKAQKKRSRRGTLVLQTNPDRGYPGLWGYALNLGRGFFTNSAGTHPASGGSPQEHIRVERFLSVPVIAGNSLVGQIALANPEEDYTERDLRAVERLAHYYALAINRIRAEQAVRESEEQLRQLTENIEDGFWLSHRGNPSRLAYVSPALERIWARTSEDFLNDPTTKIEAVHPEDRQMVEAAFQDFLDEVADLNIEYRIVRPDGSIRWIWDRGFAVKDASGSLQRVGGLAQDITRRKLYQEQQKELMEEIRHFAYIVSHDMRGPLVNIKGFSREMEIAVEVIRSAAALGIEQLPDKARQEVSVALDEDLPEALRFIGSSVNQMDRLINSILALSRIGRRDLVLEPLGMNQLVQDVLNSLAYQISRSKVAITVGPLPTTVADRTSMEQIMTNLITNAVKYLHPSRPGEVSITGHHFRDEDVYVIRDNGRGMDRMDLSRIFHVFQRAGERDVPGEGMGLAYVRTLVRRHGGTIWCESQPGMGSSFTFSVSNLLSGE